MALRWLWWSASAGIGRRRRRGTLRGTCGTWRHPPSFVALGDIYFRFTWQAWHLWHWAGSGGALGPTITQHLSHTTLSHTIFHTHLSHTSLSHTIFHGFTHHLPHTHTIFHTHNFVTHHLSHPLSHTIFVTLHLSHNIFHTPSFTPNFVTHHLWHSNFQLKDRITPQVNFFQE